MKPRTRRSAKIARGWSLCSITTLALGLAPGCGGSTAQTETGTLTPTGEATAGIADTTQGGGLPTDPKVGEGQTTPTQGPGEDTTSQVTSSTSVTSGQSSSAPDPTPACNAGEIRCGLTCVNPATDKDYCGASGNCLGPKSGRACPGIELCANAACVCPDSWVRCDGACVNPQEDASFCGAKLDCLGSNSGKKCGTNSVCKAGACTSGCRAGELLCDDNCIDPKTDFNYCGASNGCTGSEAGKTCAIGQVCSDGVCKTTCKTGEVRCGNRCIDPLTDNAFCGASETCTGDKAGVACQAPNSCVDGACALNCNSWQIKCEGSCVNPKSDPKYCGAKLDCSGGNAGTQCAADQICSNGSCIEAGCEDVNFEVNLPKSDVVFVIDKSGSMSSETIATPGGGSASRWVVLYDVVQSLINKYGSKVNFGLKLYPAADAQQNGCDVDAGVEVPVGPASNSQIMTAMPARNLPVFGETPAATGLSYAATHAVDLARTGDEPTAIMVIADGGITIKGVDNTCSADETKTNFINAAEHARANNVTVYSVGILLNATDAQLLRDVAKDSDKYVDASNKTELENKMDEILAKIPSCKVPLDPMPQFPELMSVSTSDGGSTQPAPWRYSEADCDAVKAAGHDRGFVYTKRSGPYDEIELCEQSCLDYKNTGIVKIRQDCPPPP